MGCSKLFKIDQRRTARVLCIQQVAAHALQHALRIQHFHNAALAEFVSGARGLDGGLGLAQRAGLQRAHLLVVDLVLVVGAFERGHDAQPALPLQRFRAADLGLRLGNLALAAVPQRQRHVYAEAIERDVGLALVLAGIFWVQHDRKSTPANPKIDVQVIEPSGSATPEVPAVHVIDAAVQAVEVPSNDTPDAGVEEAKPVQKKPWHRKPRPTGEKDGNSGDMINLDSKAFRDGSK